MVVIVVKLIYWIDIGNDVMDGSELMESLLNSIKPLHVAVASLTVKLQISFQDHRIIERPGSRGALLPPSPLRTVRDGFPSHSSSPTKAHPGQGRPGRSVNNRVRIWLQDCKFQTTVWKNTPAIWCRRGWPCRGFLCDVLFLPRLYRPDQWHQPRLSLLFGMQRSTIGGYQGYESTDLVSTVPFYFDAVF